MSYTFEGWLGHGPESAEGAMQWGTFEPKEWRETDVDIQITHCGICATDGHTLAEHWGQTQYRMSSIPPYLPSFILTFKPSALATNSSAQPSA